MQPHAPPHTRAACSSSLYILFFIFPLDVGRQPCETDTDIMETTRVTTASSGFLFGAFHIRTAAFVFVFPCFPTHTGGVEEEGGAYETCPD